MHSYAIEETETVLDIPENGTEFDKRQFLELSRLMLLYNVQAIGFDQFKVKLVYKLLNMVRSADLDHADNEQVVENVLNLTRHVEPYFYDLKENGTVRKVLHMNFYRQLIPSIKVGRKKYFGPSDALFNTVYGEYIQSLNSFTDFSLTGDMSHLNRLLATLYRPAIKKKDGAIKFRRDVREIFNPELTDRYAERMAKVPPDIKYAIYLYFASCQHFITTNTALDIGGGNTIDISVLYSGSGNNGVKGLGMIGTLYSIAETNVFGNSEKVARQYTYDVLAYLVEQHRKMKELERQKKKQ